MSKTCPGCKQTYLKPELHFGKNKKLKDKLSTYCKPCLSEKNYFDKEKKKQPKEIRVCLNENCDKTFETRNTEKKYCCTKCASQSNNKKNSLDRDYRFKYEFKTKFRVKKMGKPSSYKSWNAEEDGKLINLKFDGYTFWEIAEKTGRTYHACNQRYRMLIKKLDI